MCERPYVVITIVYSLVADHLSLMKFIEIDDL